MLDLSELSEGRQREALEEAAEQVQGSLDLENGPILRVGLIELGGGRPSRLLMTIHHLVVDGVSWRILLEDLERGYRQAQLGEEIRLWSKTTSWQYWARRIKQHAESEAVRNELSYWESITDKDEGRIPIDIPGGDNKVESVGVVEVSLSEEETRSLLQEAPQAYQTRIQELLMAALVATLRRWTGRSAVVVDIEGHGREEIFEEVDLTRTVGWFTTIYPQRIELGPGAGTAELIKAVKEEMRRVQRQGLGYGLLRYMTKQEEVRNVMREVGNTEVLFNYSGQFDEVAGERRLYEFRKEWLGMWRSGRTRRRHALEVSGQIGGGQLQMNLLYSENLHNRKTVERIGDLFKEELRSIIEHCQDPNAGAYTPSDFPLAELDERKFSKLTSLLNQIG